VGCDVGSFLDPPNEQLSIITPKPINGGILTNIQKFSYSITYPIYVYVLFLS
jgi:hypothetical protein